MVFIKNLLSGNLKTLVLTRKVGFLNRSNRIDISIIA